MNDKEGLTQDETIENLRNFFRGKPFLFFGSGMSCGLDVRFGMPALKDALISGIDDQHLNDEQATEWNAVVAALQDGTDLENALNLVSDQRLLRILTEYTGAYIAALDKEYAFRIANGEISWPPIEMLKRLVDTLPEGDRILHALTPNYDMLFEYSCDFTDIPYTNGLFGGVERKQRWEAVNRAMYEPQRVNQRGRMKIVYKYRRHIRLYKVHGSLNYFFHRNCVVENNAWMWGPPGYAERVLITPGLSKYQSLQRYRVELLETADKAIAEATHFLFIGYGFNDSHLEEYIKRKLITAGSPGLIITRDTNPRIEALLAEAPNLWLVCREDNGGEGSRVYNQKLPGWILFPDVALWDINEFTIRILGGYDANFHI